VVLRARRPGLHGLVDRAGKGALHEGIDHIDIHHYFTAVRLFNGIFADK